MPATRRHSLEMSGGSATLYLNGSLTLDRALQALDACRLLPGHVRRLRVDMRAINVVDAVAVTAISKGLRSWRGDRNGSTRVDLPGAPVSFEVLALPEAPVSQVTASHARSRDTSVAHPCPRRDGPTGCFSRRPEGFSLAAPPTARDE